MSVASSSFDTKRLAALCLGATGIVYGDIGTSPLYAIKARR
ncbi:KUP/HAK/KT family potassium transporter [Magnetospirillum moscoviense]|nr:KUP/HAK/KT family potassium transporter [Magnetospirillum moscoviense]